MRKQVADRNARLPVMLELPRAGQCVAAAVELGGLHLQPERFAVFLLQARLGVEGIHARRAAVHVEENDALGLGLEVRLLGRQRAGAFGLRLIRQHRGQRQTAKAIGATRQHVPPCKWRLRKLTAMMHGGIV